MNKRYNNIDITEKLKVYLDSIGGKEAVEKIINDGIEKFKNNQAYEWYDNGCTFDMSGEIRKIPGKTIGDIWEKDLDILQALTGNSEATYISGCGLLWNNVAHEISYDISEYLYKAEEGYVLSHKDEIRKEIGFEDEITEENLLDVMDYIETINICIMHDWFGDKYTIHHKNELVEWDEELFNV